MKRCECGEILTGHEDESATKCRWCVTGWKPSQDHVASADCWCNPTPEHRDPVTGKTVYVHHKPN